jgi:L-rhamnose mutarotase
LATETEDIEVVAFRMVLHAGQAEEYRRRHDQIWPELTAGLLAAGALDYRIWLDPRTGHLFAVLTRRRDHDLDRLRTTEIMRRWWSLMSDIMATHPDQSPQEQALEPMFVLSAPPAR